ncbi:DegV family protein [Weissella sp. LMG 11983]|uniref:DegV family protein n=1 Tax=Weissella sp. LMG 11983 TaxID=2987700 RepID=UPI0021F886BF|nr:DegV family protein [Weissella sp. LMG 11983]MCW0926257.1 DegV family protein [Weissella sp. LMG 11983]
MSKIAVLVDSSSYIAPADLAALNIYQINDPIMMGEQVFHENESWASQEDFYTFQRTADPALTTSQPEIGAFMDKFDELAEAGYTDVIVIVLSSGISGAFSSLEIIGWNGR